MERNRLRNTDEAYGSKVFMCVCVVVVVVVADGSGGGGGAVFPLWWPSAENITFESGVNDCILVCLLVCIFKILFLIKKYQSL